MQENKKALMIGLAAAGVLLGGYALYCMRQPKGIVDKLKKDGLTEVQRDSKGQLDHSYFLNLLQFIGEETKLRTVTLRKQRRDERRKHYNSQNWKAYEAVIKQTIEGEDITA